LPKHQQIPSRPPLVNFKARTSTIDDPGAGDAAASARRLEPVQQIAAALDAKHRQRFKNEAQAGTHLQHPHIVPVYYVGCERGVHFYAMQLIDGHTLASLIGELRRVRQPACKPAPPRENASERIRPNVWAAPVKNIFDLLDMAPPLWDNPSVPGNRVAPFLTRRSPCRRLPLNPSSHPSMEVGPMSFSHGQGGHLRKAPRRLRCRPGLEVVEGRCVPTTLTPTTFADGGLGSGSLRDAVLQFNADTGTADDTIQLEAGTYSLTIQNTHGHETAGLEGELNLTQTSHRGIIQGAGPSTIIDASQLQDRVFQIVNPGIQVVVQDLVITGGLAQDDGSDGALAGTTDALGGGILNNGGDVALDDVVVQNNLARGGDAAVRSTPGHNARGGGIYSTGAALTMAGAAIANNQATGGRGGDYNGSQVAGKGGDGSGGGLYATGGSLDISGSMIANNRVTGGRGGDG
jgi:hypothetical protein